MRTLFLLIRVPFFILGAAVWLGIGILALAVGFYLSVFIPLALMIWGVILLGALITAAFENDGTTFSRFLLSSRKRVVEAVKLLGDCAALYFQAYPELWKWLLAPRQKTR